ncbi:hypothetical protein ES703_101417 [subsurface metagenome]
MVVIRPDLDNLGINLCHPREHRIQVKVADRLNADEFLGMVQGTHGYVAVEGSRRTAEAVVLRGLYGGSQVEVRWPVNVPVPVNEGILTTE